MQPSGQRRCKHAKRCRAANGASHLGQNARTHVVTAIGPEMYGAHREVPVIVREGAQNLVGVAEGWMDVDGPSPSGPSAAIVALLASSIEMYLVRMNRADVLNLDRQHGRVVMEAAVVSG